MLRAFEQGGIFIVPHLLWHGTSVFPVSSEGPSIQSPLTTRLGMRKIYSNLDPHGEIAFVMTCKNKTMKSFCRRSLSWSIPPPINIRNFYVKYFVEPVKETNTVKRKPECSKEWSPCSVTCGYGLSHRYGSDTCDVINDTRICYPRPCDTSKLKSVSISSRHRVPLAILGITISRWVNGFWIEDYYIPEQWYEIEIFW
jgi:hypothetical protein